MAIPVRPYVCLAPVVVLALSAISGSLRAADTQKAVFEWDLRLRHEAVDDAGFARRADATTARLRAGLRLAPAPGWSMLLEGEGVAGTGSYNSGANGKTAYPTVLDPTSAELNQAWVAWTHERGSVTVGRQRIALDNQRWVGNVGWRQNEQTFDAVELRWQPTTALAVRYDWLDKVHRVASDRALAPLARARDLDTHLLNVAWKRGGQQWVGYAYLHDDRDVASASTATYGLRWTGSAVRDGRGFGWAAEIARQQDYAHNPARFHHAYWLLEPSWTQGGITARAGWEHLGGDGATAVQTPLATLHAFNGWDDQFLVTPAKGLEDRYLTASGKAGYGQLEGKLVWTLAWHDYRADTGRLRYGQELNASLGFPLPGGLTGLVKLADYRADGFARDNRKLWLQVEWRGKHPLQP
ncbi:alginate export family protein [Thermomonas alba]|uniref:alginate export family protein n=1 Tax=Thermomonas alba TaxID=2888525 RepID=UPI001F03ED07|nr:alginate export family protein [Thermomonas alba]